MSQFIHISTGFSQHPKTIRLQKVLDYAGVVSLIQLWSWAAIQRPNGDLSGLDDDDIEFTANWKGEPGAFTAALVKLRWLDGEAGHRTLHGWDEHNGDPSGAQGAAGRNRLHSLARYKPEAYQDLKAQGITGLSRSEYAAVMAGGSQFLPDSPAGLPRDATGVPVKLPDFPITPEQKREERAAKKLAATLESIIDPSARGGDDDQIRAVDALLIFPHEGKKLSRAAAVEWAARMQVKYPKVNLYQAIQEAAREVMDRKTPVKNPRIFLSNWLKRAYTSN